MRLEGKTKRRIPHAFPRQGSPAYFLGHFGLFPFRRNPGSRRTNGKDGADEDERERDEVAERGDAGDRDEHGEHDLGAVPMGHEL